MSSYNLILKTNCFIWSAGEKRIEKAKISSFADLNDIYANDLDYN